jgi:hypothetical protein
VLTKLARVGMIVAAMVLGVTTFALAETSATPAPTVVVAQATPAAKSTPNPFTYHGFVRAYDFYRDNAYSGHSAANQQSENNAISLSGNYRFEDTGLSVGASYLYANPLNNCTEPSSDLIATSSCYQSKAAPAINPDNTLPSFQMSTLYEAYLNYDKHGVFFRGGDQVFNSPWAPSSDSRLKPVSYQGVDLGYHINKQWTIEGADFWQWECRTCSNFDRGTLLTVLNPGGYAYSGANPYPANNYDPTQTSYYNNGFFYGRLGYTGEKAFPLTANAYYYAFNNIADAVWFDAKLPLAFTGRYKGFVAAQGGSEANAGNSLVGKIQSSVYGVLAGFNPLSNVTLTGAYDDIPVHTAVVTLPYGFSCAANHTISSPKLNAGNIPYFLPSGGTGNCLPAANGQTELVYGGWASPYTDSYATDPLFVASGTQSMPDRRSPGQAFKVAATFLSDDKQFTLTLAQTWYDYNNPAYAQSTTGTDLDTQYFFSHMPKTGLYKGFSLRVRLFSRSESTFAGSPAVGLFKYSRFQAEYDF